MKLPSLRWPDHVVYEAGGMIELTEPVVASRLATERLPAEALSEAARRLARERGGEMVGRWDVLADGVRHRVTWVRWRLAADDPQADAEAARVLVEVLRVRELVRDGAV